MKRRDFIFYSIGAIASGAILTNVGQNVKVKTVLVSPDVSLNFLKTSIFNIGESNKMCYGQYKQYLQKLVKNGELIGRELLEVSDNRLVFEDVWENKNSFENYSQSLELAGLIKILNAAHIKVEHLV